MPLETGLLLSNRYRIVETIAVGGMGAIYRASDDSLGIQVAVKENFFTTNEFSRQFRREATILASLRHPNLPRVTDHFVIQDQGQYLVMDYIEGEDLRQIINHQGTLPEEHVVKIGIAISDALAYLHSRNPAIVHRDIKPGNIKVTPAGQVFLVDFGLAKVARGEATTTGAQALTPGYAPPEQYGQGTEPRSDIYALGATLYATLTGKIPEDGLSRAMGTVELTPIRKYNPLVSEQTARVVEKAMAVRPDDRYQTAEDLKLNLETALRLLQGNPPVERFVPDEATIQRANVPGHETTGVAPGGPDGPVVVPAEDSTAGAAADLPTGASRPARRRRPILWGALGGLLVISLVVGGISLFSSQRALLPLAGPSATHTTTSSATLLPPTATHTLAPSATVALPTDTPAPVETATEAAPTSTFTPAATPAGGGDGSIAFASDRGGLPQVWLMNADGQDLRQVTSLSDGACQPAWSPDGQKLVFISPCAGMADTYPGASMFIIQTDGTGLLPLVSLPGGDFEPKWSPDGAQLVFTSLRDGRPHIYLYHLTDNTVTRLSKPSSYEQHPTWSPDGARIAYESTNSGQPAVWVMNADGSEPRQFSNGANGFAYSPVWSPLNDIMVYAQAANQRWLVARQIDNPAAGEFKVNERTRPVYDPSFSPDGWWITFTTIVDNNTDIYRMQRNGANLIRLTDDAGVDFHPAWKP